MAVLSPSNLETCAIGVSGWNAIYSGNFELINTKLGAAMAGASAFGDDDVSDPAVQTSEDLTDSTGGTPATTIVAVSGSGADSDINNNFASLTDQVKKLVADVDEIRDAIVALLAALRGSTGCGILDN